MKIRSLELWSRDIPKLKHFYLETLGLTNISDVKNGFILHLQNTDVRFTEDESATPYHFAINIPCNQEQEALNWLKKRVPILMFQGDEMIDFSAWNAKSMYFYDTDRNIVELIARKNLVNQSSLPFGPLSLIEISEIGLITKNIFDVYHYLKENFQLEVFDGGMTSFCAIGDDRGLFIVIDENKGTWFPADDKAYPSSFTIEIIKDNEPLQLAYNGQNLS